MSMEQCGAYPEELKLYNDRKSGLKNMVAVYLSEIAALKNNPKFSIDPMMGEAEHIELDSMEKLLLNIQDTMIAIDSQQVSAPMEVRV